MTRIATMHSPIVSVVVPAFNEEETLGRTLEELKNYLGSTSLTYEILVVDDGSTDGSTEVVEAAMLHDPHLRLIELGQNEGKGAAVRRGVLESSGDVVAFIDADLPYRVENLGEALALVQTGGADIVIGARDLPESTRDPSYPWIRQIMGRSFSYVVRSVLVPGIPDTQCGLKAFSGDAAHLLFSESKLKGFSFDFEVLFLARKYGFRIERIPVALSHRHSSKVRLGRDSLSMLWDVWRVRRWNRLQAYRAPRRCPVCFSSEVGSLTQIREWVVRACYRCKCRYLNSFPSEDELEVLYNSSYFTSGRDSECGYASRTQTKATRKTNERRLAVLRKHLSSQSRVLEVGAGNGLFGDLASKEFSYVGIDCSDEAVREGRGRGLELYRATLHRFVNTGPAFDGIALFHVFEHLPDPHSALATIAELLKPGGILVLITPDTESFLCSVSGDRWVSYKFPEHLILYSRSALIELLEHSGFELISAGSDFEYAEQEFLLSRLEALSKPVARLASAAMKLLPDPMPATTGSIRIAARRRSGPPVAVRTIRAVEPTHAR